MEPVMQYYYTTIDVTSRTPTRDGYTFAGWAQPIPSRITEDITLVATWTAASNKLQSNLKIIKTSIVNF